MNVSKIEWSPERPLFRPLSEDRWELWEDVYYSFFCKQYRTVAIPAGYVYDGASVPRIFWRIAGHPMDTETVMASLIHDFCFTHRPYIGQDRVNFADSADLYEAVAHKCGLSRFTLQIHSIAIRSPIAKQVWRKHDDEF